MKITLSQPLLSAIPNLSVGIIIYNNIVISESPQMLKGRLQLYQESITMEFDTKTMTDFPGLKEWRHVFKQVGTDPSRYRPSVEALYRRLKKNETIPLIHSAADINNFFSLQYQIPIGIYDLDHIEEFISIDIGNDRDVYEALNGREMSFTNKLLSRDLTGAFGSPIADSKRTAVSPSTTNAVQIFYLQPSMSSEEADKLLAASEKMFLQIHGGTAKHFVVSDT